MLTALLISLGVGLAASHIRGMSCIVIVSALTFSSGYMGLLFNGSDIPFSIVIAALMLAVMQTGYVVGVLSDALVAPTGSRARGGKSR